MSNLSSVMHKRFDSFHNYYLYGATPAAAGAKSLLERYGKVCLGVIDRDPKKQGSDLYDLPIIAPADLFSNHDEKSGIIIVSAYQKEISQFLGENGISSERIFPHLDGMFFPTYDEQYGDNEWLDRVYDGLTCASERDFFQSWRDFKCSGDLGELKPIPSLTRQYDHQDWFSEIEPNGRALDVGAYDGVTSVAFSLTGKFCEVIAFEPFEANYNLLQKTAQSHDGPAKIITEAKAIGAKREVLFLEPADESSRATLMSQSKCGASDEKQRIDVWPLDALGYENVTLIKVDIEGYELDFLSGAKATLTACRPHLAISAYHHVSHPAAIAKYLYENFEGVSIRVGHHPLAVYELEYYVSFNRSYC